jgi:hypothetical protein
MVYDIIFPTKRERVGERANPRLDDYGWLSAGAAAGVVTWHTLVPRLGGVPRMASVKVPVSAHPQLSVLRIPTSSSNSLSALHRTAASTKQILPPRPVSPLDQLGVTATPGVRSPSTTCSASFLPCGCKSSHPIQLLARQIHWTAGD